MWVWSSQWQFSMALLAASVYNSSVKINSLQRVFKYLVSLFQLLSVWKKFFKRLASNIELLVVSFGLSGELSPQLYGLDTLLAIITADMRRERTLRWM